MLVLLSWMEAKASIVFDAFLLTSDFGIEIES